jgi:putative membrane protein
MAVRSLPMNRAAHDPDPNTLLAMQRNLMASDRTLMAWIRTSLSLMGFGFTLAKVFRALAEEHIFLRGPAGNIWTAEAVGMALLLLGVFALVAAIFDHHHDLKQLRAAGLERRFSLPMAVASMLAIVGCMGLLSVTMRH